MPSTLRQLGLQATDDLRGTDAPLVARLEVDQHAAAVERRVRAVDADERRQAGHGGILEHHRSQSLLALCHCRERDRLWCLGDPLYRARILHREKALGYHDVEHHRKDEREHGDDQRRTLTVEHPIEHGPVTGDDTFEQIAAPAIETALLVRRRVLQQLGAHHRGKRQRNDCRNQDRHGEGDGELAEQTADDVTHEQQRNQHRDEREGQGNDGECDLLRAFQRRLQRRLTLLDVAGDVLDDHDRIVDDEAGGDRQRHQRQVVDRESRQIHHAESTDE